MFGIPVDGYYLTLASLAVCAIVGIVVAVRFRREVDDDLAPPTSKDVLDPLEQAYYAGLMHPEEIERIRESVQKSKMKSKVVPRPSAKLTERTTTIDESPIEDPSPGHHPDDVEDE